MLPSSFIVFSCLSLVVSTFGAVLNPFVCPSKCKCSSNEWKCRSASWPALALALENIDPSLSPESLTLDSVEGLEAITDITFVNLPRLVSLDLNNCNVKDIHKKAFDSVNRLVSLRISGNPVLSVLDETTFDDLFHLETLDLSSNKLTSLPQNIFLFNTQLRSISLKGNGLTTIEGMHWFKNTRELIFLDFSRNVLTSLPGKDFMPLEPMSNLKTLLFTSNIHLKQLESTTFENFTSLTTLDLSDCNLVWFPRGTFEPLLPSLTSLMLHDNPWVCDCAIIDMYEWLMNHRYLFSNQADLRCDRPSGLYGRPLLEDDSQLVYCPPTTTTQATTSTTSTKQPQLFPLNFGDNPPYFPSKQKSGFFTTSNLPLIAVMIVIGLLLCLIVVVFICHRRNRLGGRRTNSSGSSTPSKTTVESGIGDSASDSLGSDHSSSNVVHHKTKPPVQPPRWRDSGIRPRMSIYAIDTPLRDGSCSDRNVTLPSASIKISSEHDQSDVSPIQCGGSTASSSQSSSQTRTDGSNKSLLLQLEPGKLYPTQVYTSSSSHHHHLFAHLPQTTTNTRMRPESLV